MIQGSLAKRYALALLELADEAGGLAALGKSLAAFAELLEMQPMLQRTLANETLPAEERKKVLQVLFKNLNLGSITERFFLLLVDKKRFGNFSDIHRQFIELADERGGVVHAEVTSAKPMSSKAQEQLQSELKRITGKSVDLKVSVDPATLGGLVTRIGHTVFDGSVATHLERLKERMLKKSSGPSAGSH